LRHRPPRGVTSAGLSKSAAVGVSTWSAAARAARRSSSKPATAVRPGSGAKISADRGHRGPWSSRAWPAVTRVCAYDRPGTVAPLKDDVRPSRSDPVPQPRTAPDAVADLHVLLRAAGIPGPYVLAGHSLGGLFVRLYASTYLHDPRLRVGRGGARLLLARLFGRWFPASLDNPGDYATFNSYQPATGPTVSPSASAVLRLTILS
jgi:pimeloyl-ACP methyl ester carboxylesterase